MKAKRIVNNEYPYLGLEAYREEHSKYFFGRNREIDILLNLIMKNSVTVVFGKSGVGKTSLLQAGLLSKLRKNYFLPIPIRTNFSDSEISPIEDIKENIYKELSKKEKETKIFDNETLWEYFHKNKVLGGLVTPVIILDQFEEIFTHGRKRISEVKKLIRELADIIENQIPQSVQKKYKDSDIPFEIEEFKLKVIISLREDYLPNLESYNAFIPSLKKSRFRVEQMKQENALEAVWRPAQHIINQKYATKVVDMLYAQTIENFDGVKDKEEIYETQSIEPFILSLVCEQINNTRINENEQEITNDLLKEIDVNKIIKSFYNQSISDLSSAAQNTLEDGLLTNEGYRKLQHKSDLLRQNSITQEDINKLIDRRIIRNTVYNGSEHLEFIHDVLISVVKESRDLRKKEEERVRIEEERQKIIHEEEEKNRLEKNRLRKEYEEKEHLQKLKSKKIRQMLVGLSVFLIIVTIFAIYANNQRQIAETNEKEAKANQGVANVLLTKEKNPTLAFRIAEYAYSKSKNDEIFAALLNAFYSGIFYDILLETKSTPTVIDIEPVKKEKLLTVEGKSLIIRNVNGKIEKIKKHKNIITDACFSPDGKEFITVTKKGEVFLWDLKSEKINLKSKAHDETITSVCFSPDGKYFVTTSEDNYIILWKRTGEIIGKRRLSADVFDAAFSPDSNIFAAVKNSEIFVWNLDFEELLNIENEGYKYTKIAIDKDNNIYTTCNDSLFIWNKKGKFLRKIKEHQGEILKIKFLENNSNFITTSADKTLILWDKNANVIDRLNGHDNAVLDAVVLEKKRKIISISADKTFRTWKTNNVRKGKFRKFKNILYYAEFSDRQELITASKKQAIVYDRTGKEKIRLRGHNQSVICARFSPNNEYYATASTDKTARIWNKTGKQIAVINHTANVNWVDFSPDGKYLASASCDSTAKVSDMKGKLVHKLIGHTGTIYAIRYSPDGKRIITASSDETARIWTKKGNLLAICEGHEGYVLDANFSPNGKYCATASADRSIRVWDLEGNLLQTLKGHTENVNSISFSPDNKYIASGSEDGTIRIWNMKGKELFVFKQNLYSILNVSFDKKNTYLFSLSRDRTLRRWLISPLEIFRLVENGTLGSTWQLDEITRKRYNIDF